MDMFVGEMMGNGNGTSSPMPWAGKPGKHVHMYEASIGRTQMEVGR